ncbi:MAG: DHA2 family efflux MFS transporter permease subunit [Bacteroidetes bacterium]|nr:DHA2 family efflux MFS transporter permease subunit [Bacteroidota bacterium]
MATPKGFAKFIIVLTCITAAIMELIDTSIVNVALTNISGSLGVNIEDTSWIITAYAIANVIIIPLTGFLAEYFGRKKYYIGSMILFTVASYLCAQSGSLVEIVIWRFIQGIGGGALLSTSQAILFDTFEPKDRPIAAGIFGMGIVLGPTLGPTVGGYIIDHASWPLIFIINIPIGIIATFLSIYFIEEKPGEGTRKKEIHIDYTGILLLTVGIGCLQYVLERGESEDWFNSRIIQVTSFVATTPAVNLRVLGNTNLAFTTLFTFVIGFGLFTSVFVFPILAQRVLGFTAYETGLTLLAPTLITLVTFPVIGKLMSKGFPPIPFVVIGFLFFALYAWMNSRLSPDVGRWDFYLPLLFRAIGISMVQIPLINQAVAGLAPKDYPAGIALNNMIRQLGGAFGIALANNYISNRYAVHRYHLVENITSESEMFYERSSNIAKGIIARSGDVAGASSKALATINQVVDRQAYYLSYLDTFLLVTVFFLVMIPFAVFLKAKKQSPAEISATAKASEDAH